MFFKWFASLLNTGLRQLIISSLALFIIVVGSPAHADSYTLAAGDKLRITLLENKQINDVYQVEIDGTVSLPGIGVVRAVGLELRAFEQDLRTAASEFIDNPSLSVQIAEYRPFFVLGDVDKPGMYPFTPGLNAMRAIAIAGGFGRKVDTDTLSRSVAINQARKSLIEGEVDLLFSQVNLARLKAERDMEATFTYQPTSATAAKHPKLPEILDAATVLFETRQSSFAKQLDKLQGTLAARTKEIGSYESQLNLQTEAMATSQQELIETRDLRKRGLVPENRVNEIVRVEQNVRARSLQIVTLKRQAETNQATVEREITDLITSRELDIDTNIQALEIGLVRLESQIREDRAFLLEAGASVQVLGDEAPAYRLELHRDGVAMDVDVDFGTVIQPDDTLVVVLNKNALLGN